MLRMCFAVLLHIVRFHRHRQTPKSTKKFCNHIVFSLTNNLLHQLVTLKIGWEKMLNNASHLCHRPREPTYCTKKNSTASTRILSTNGLLSCSRPLTIDTTTTAVLESASAVVGKKPPLAYGTSTSKAASLLLLFPLLFPCRSSTSPCHSPAVHSPPATAGDETASLSSSPVRPSVPPSGLFPLHYHHHHHHIASVPFPPFLTLSVSFLCAAHTDALIPLRLARYRYESLRRPVEAILFASL